jgi:16S rRNA processing protein RimM
VTVPVAGTTGQTKADWLELGRIGAPYGIKGWVHVQSFTSPPETLLKYRIWTLTTARDGPAPDLAAVPARKVLEARAQGSGIVARLEGVEDRDRAALLQGSIISVARSAMPKLRRREFYQADLIGLSVTNLEGVGLGKVMHFVETPGGDVMVVRADSGHEHWVPATKTHLAKVDLAAGQVVVDWPVELE